MHWKYKLNPAQDHHFMFDGQTLITPKIKEEIPLAKIVEIIFTLQHAAVELGGLDYIQEFTELTSGKVVWVLDGMSEEEKIRLHNERKLSPKEIQEYNVKTILFPEEY